MGAKETAKRYFIFILGLFFAGLGVAFTKHGGLGVTPVSSIPNVLSFEFTALSLGNWLIVWNCVLIVLQILILRRDFKPVQLLQVPLSFLFGYFTDFGMKIATLIPVNSYSVQLLMLLIGIAVLGFGITLSVGANVIMNSGEAFVKAVSDKSKKAFGNVKVIFDVSSVIISIILSLIFFSGKIVGTREGTVISALTTGFVVKFFTRYMKKVLDRFFGEKEK